jgi:penicillin-binding protein 1A
MLAGCSSAEQIPAAGDLTARARNVVLDNLVEAGLTEVGLWRPAQSGDANDRKQEDAPNYYLDWAFDEMRKLVDTFEVGHRKLIVRTAIEPNLQRYAEHEVNGAAAVRTRLRCEPSRW